MARVCVAYTPSLTCVTALWPDVRRLGPPRRREGRWRRASGAAGAALITSAEVSGWVGSLMARGLAPSTATRALATLRSILAFAVADARVQHNVAAAAHKPTSGRARREGQALTSEELRVLMEACRGRYRDVVPVLADPVNPAGGVRLGLIAGNGHYGNAQF